ncbi:VIT family protein [Pinirhizobacter sp.]|jgi:VIT1/CCC1 family predicted Fe2+/Mn2+ transporter|uniref:VIT1/CCC1 transporter family protein n=1 Tax=Pinirhizobacter sp. TaxID=2950432 RepID=UPI002F3F6928
MSRRHPETHASGRVAWLRAAVLGANDGVISVASLAVGVAASGQTQGTLMATCAAGLIAGAMSMAAGEYVSVRSQADTEHADLALERQELATDPDHELAELTHIYQMRGLDAALAHDVATQLMAHDALGAHARDELGITEELRARPVQASMASALAFSLGASVPLVTVAVAPAAMVVFAIIGTALASLLILGAAAARVGNAPVWRGAWRVFCWGALAMGITAAVGHLFGS